MRSASARALRRGLGRRGGAAQYAVLVVALGQRIEGDLAIAAAGGDDRQLAAKIGRRLGDGGAAAEDIERRRAPRWGG